MSRIEFKSYRFRKERESSWSEFEQLIGKAEGEGIDSLSAEELNRLPSLYRSVLASLSVARGISLDRNLLYYLENLASRGYLCIYGVHRGFRRAFGSFLWERFPREVCRHWRLVAIAASIMLLGILTGFSLTVSDPDNYYMIMPTELAQERTPTSSSEELRLILYHETSVSDCMWAFATFLFTNNAKVGILAFGLGFALGVPVFFLLFGNGAVLGALAALYHRHGMSLEFWAWVIPHGFTELFAIILCGAGGLLLARGIVFPGRNARIHNLAKFGRQAGLLVLGAVPMFGVAALIEGLFRQHVHDLPIRLLVAAGTVILWVVYFLRAGRYLRR